MRRVPPRASLLLLAALANDAAMSRLAPITSIVSDSKVRLFKSDSFSVVAGRRLPTDARRAHTRILTS